MLSHPPQDQAVPHRHPPHLAQPPKTIQGNRVYRWDELTELMDGLQLKCKHLFLQSISVYFSCVFAHLPPNLALYGWNLHSWRLRHHLFIQLPFTSKCGWAEYLFCTVCFHQLPISKMWYDYFMMCYALSPNANLINLYILLQVQGRMVDFVSHNAQAAGKTVLRRSQSLTNLRNSQPLPSAIKGQVPQ